MISVNLINFYTGIESNDIKMDGFKSLILPNLGGVTISLDFINIKDSYFHDGILAEFFIDISYLSD